MLQLIKTNSSNVDFKELVQALDAYLQEKDGTEHAFFAQFNKIDAIQYVVVAYWDNTPVGCGAIKSFDEDTMEVKRMYVSPSFRGHKIATKILTNLETWAKELNFTRCILETGIRQSEAINLYKQCNYQSMPNYGQYDGVASSVCFEKIIK